MAWDSPCKWRRGKRRLVHFAPVALIRKAAEPRILYGEPVELAAAEPSLIRDVDGSLLFSVRLCARLFHAAALQEVGGAGIEGVGQVHEQETGCEQRMGRAVGEAEAPHDGAYGSSNYLEVGAGGPVRHPHLLEGAGGGVVVGPVQIRWLTVAVAMRRQPQAAQVPLWGSATPAVPSARRAWRRSVASRS